MLVGISGKRGSGKDTAARALLARDFTKLSFADPIKAFAEEVFEFTYDQLYGPSESREAVDPRWGVSPREVLQKLGTEWGRALNEDVWVKHLIRRYRAIQTVGGYPGAVTTDLRFPNEVRCVRDAGGLVFRIERPLHAKHDAASLHPSETALDDYREWDAVIVNDGTIEELLDQVNAVVDLMRPRGEKR